MAAERLKLNDEKASKLVRMIRDSHTEGDRFYDRVIGNRVNDAWCARQGFYDSCTLAGGELIDDPTEMWKQPYLNKLGEKMRAFSAIFRGVYIHGDKSVWTMKPTEVLDIPESVRRDGIQQVIDELILQYGLPDDFSLFQQYVGEIRQLAENKWQQTGRTRMKNAERLMRDQQREGRFHEAMECFLDNLSWSPYAVFKGPTVGWLNTARWYGDRYDEGMATGPVWSSPFPSDVRFSPDSTDGCDGSYVYELMHWCHSDLWLTMENASDKVLDIGGFRKDAIARLLEQNPDGLRDWHSMNRNNKAYKGRTEDGYSFTGYDVIESHNKLPGHMLREHDITKTVRGTNVEPGNAYEVTSYICNDHLIGVCAGQYPTGIRPYAVLSVDRVANCVYGQGNFDIGWDTQRMINAAVKHMMKNAAFSSDPIGFGTINRFVPGEAPIRMMVPGRFYGLKDYYAGSGEAMKLLNVPSNLGPLENMLALAMNQMDQVLQLPNIQTGGIPQGGLGRTLGGLSLVLNQGQKAQRGLLHWIDSKVFKKTLQAQHRYNMINVATDSIKFDADIAVSGVDGLFQRDIAFASSLEMLQQAIGLSQLGIVDQRGLTLLARDAFASRGLDVDQIFPDAQSQIALQNILSGVNTSSPGLQSPLAGLDGRSQPPFPTGANEPSQLAA